MFPSTDTNRLLHTTWTSNLISRQRFWSASSPAAGVTPRLSDLSLLVQRRSRKGRDEARCWDWSLCLRLDELTFNRRAFKDVISGYCHRLGDMSVSTSWKQTRHDFTLWGLCYIDLNDGVFKGLWVCAGGYRREVKPAVCTSLAPEDSDTFQE